MSRTRSKTSLSFGSPESSRTKDASRICKANSEKKKKHEEKEDTHYSTVATTSVARVEEDLLRDPEHSFTAIA